MVNICKDKTGFPLIEVPELGHIHLWPVTKVQFEQFIAETNSFGDKWYETILEGNPRVSFRNFNQRNYEGIFITSILSGEALEFARWLGNGFDLPTVEEWRHLYKLLMETQIGDLHGLDLLSPAGTIWERITGLLNSSLRVSMMEHGLMDWVRMGEEYRCLGRPRTSFHPNAYAPLRDTPIKPMHARLKQLGFRLIRRD